jgi:ribonuclease PH
MRPSNRKRDQLREISIITNVNKYAEGSCLVKFGDTHVLCTASLEERVPHFLKGKGTGWVSAEYSMLPRATHSRNNRDSSGSKPNGRALEIQRLIGRSLRAVVDMNKLGERQITIDCDVIQADGGTRCAAITGGFVALQIAINRLLKNRIIRTNPILGSISAVSCGIYNNMSVVDLDYAEDSNCESDVNFVMNSSGKIIEVQGTAEKNPFSFEQLSELYNLASTATLEITAIQLKAINENNNE